MPPCERKATPAGLLAQIAAVPGVTPTEASYAYALIPIVATLVLLALAPMVNRLVRSSGAGAS